MFLNNGGIDDEAGGNVGEEDKEGIGGEIHVGDKEAADSTVVKSALKPLRSVGVSGIFVGVGEVTAETADAFRAHGIAFLGVGQKSLEWVKGLKHTVGHGRRAYVEVCQHLGYGNELLHGYLPPIWSFSNGSSISFSIAK